MLLLIRWSSSTVWWWGGSAGECLVAKALHRAAELPCEESFRVSIPSIVNWHLNPLNQHRLACDCEYTHQRHQQDEPHQISSVGCRNLTAILTTPHGPVSPKACYNKSHAGQWINGRWYLGCSREVEGCAKGYHIGRSDIDLLRTYGCNSTQSWLDARVHDPEQFRSSPVDNSLSSHPSSKLSSVLLLALIRPPRFKSQHSNCRVQSTNADTRNRCQRDILRIDLAIGNQFMDVSFNIGNEN